MAPAFACAAFSVLLGAPPLDTPDERREMLARLERIFTGLAASHRDLPRDTFDVQGVIAAAGRDPERLFAWVRDRTAWAPYQGSLRGPTGVLLDRLGSSLDRSLLLADLLRAAGHKARLARAALPEAEAGALLDKLRSLPVKPEPGTGPSSAESAPDAAPDVEAARALEEAAGRVAARAAVLRAAVQLSPLDPQVERREAEAALRDHWWVELEAKGGWTPLDPLLPDAVPGRALLPPAETVELQKGAASLAVPPALRHEVEVRVVVERLEKGERTEGVALSVTLQPADLIGKRVALFHHPLAWPDGLRLSGDKEGEEALKKALVAQKEWLPIIAVGGARVSKASFTDTGDLNEAPVLDPRAKLARGVGRAIGGFGALGGGEEKKPQSVLASEWIEFEVRAPGRPSWKTRSEAFDLLGPAARAKPPPDFAVGDGPRLDRALALFGEVEILLLGARLTPELAAHLETEELMESRGKFKALGAVDDAEKWKQAMGRLAWEAGRPRPLSSFAALRSDLNRFAGDVFLDRPNAVTCARRYRWDAKSGFMARDIIDVVANQVAVRHGAAVAPALIRLEQGVADTVAEDLALGREIGLTENTATVFALAEAAESPVTALAGADAALDLASWSPGVEARVRQDLAAGFVVAIPRDPVQLGGESRTGWWRVDPATGGTIGVMDTGYRAATSDYSEVTVITTREQALRRYLEWFTKQSSMRFYRLRYGGAGKYNVSQLRSIENLQSIASKTLDYMRYLGIGA